jgi:hypothetical protein
MQHIEQQLIMSESILKRTQTWRMEQLARKGLVVTGVEREMVKIPVFSVGQAVTQVTSDLSVTLPGRVVFSY